MIRERTAALLWRAVLRSGSAGRGGVAAMAGFAAAVARRVVLATDCDRGIVASPEFGGLGVAGLGLPLSVVADAAEMEREKAGFRVSSSVPS